MAMPLAPAPTMRASRPDGGCGSVGGSTSRLTKPISSRIMPMYSVGMRWLMHTLIISDISSSSGSPITGASKACAAAAERISSAMCCGKPAISSATMRASRPGRYGASSQRRSPVRCTRHISRTRRSPCAKASYGASFIGVSQRRGSPRTSRHLRPPA